MSAPPRSHADERVTRGHEMTARVGGDDGTSPFASNEVELLTHDGVCA